VRVGARIVAEWPDRTIYGVAVIGALTIIWEAADRICGKRLKSVLPTFVEFMEYHGHLCLDGEVRERLLGMSAATIDRALRPVRMSQARSTKSICQYASAEEHRCYSDLRGLEESATRLLRDGHGGSLRRFGGGESRSQFGLDRYRIWLDRSCGINRARTNADHEDARLDSIWIAVLDARIRRG
jgi:hypothetical protein